MIKHLNSIKSEKIKVILFFLFFVLTSLLALFFLRFEISRYYYLRKKCATTSNNTHQSFSIKIPQEYKVHGIDVSHYLCKIDWKKVANMRQDSIYFDFVFVRGTIGNHKKDFLFDENWSALKRTKLLRGAYHYFYPSESGSDQANNFLRHINIEKGDLPPILDIEETGLEDIKDIRIRMKRWLQIVTESTNCVPIIYCNKNIYDIVIKNYFDDYNIWIANYNEGAASFDRKMPWLFWQYSQSGKVDGICENVDFNVFNGTLSDLKAITKE